MNLGQVFQLSHWQSGIVFLFILFSLIFIIFLNKKVNWSKTILVSIIIGIIGGLIIFSLNQSIGKLGEEGEILWHEDVLIWLNVFPGMFISLMLLFIPFAVFVNIFLALTKPKVSAKAFVKTLLSFAFFIVIAILVAFALWPIFSQVNFSSSVMPEGEEIAEGNSSITIPGSIVGWIPTSISVFADSLFVMSCIIVAIFFAVVVNILEKDHQERAQGIISGINNLQTLINTCLKYIVKLIPLVIISSLPLLFMEDIGQNFASIGIYLFGFFVGVFLIMFIMTFIQLVCKSKGLSTKKVFKALDEPLAFSFFSQSSKATIPLTIKALDDLNIDKSISSTMPQMGTSMGVIVCSAFYPVSLALVTMNNVSGFGIGSSLTTFFILLFIVALVGAFGVAGVHETSPAASITILGAMGLPLSFYTLILAADPLLDKFRTLGNVDAIITNFMFQDKLHKSGNQSKKAVDKVMAEFEYNNRYKRGNK